MNCTCKTASTREAAMVVLRRDGTGIPTVWCDQCIAPLVAALNAGGIATVASCCGHGRRPGAIAFADGRELIICRNWEEARLVERAVPFDANGEPIAGEHP